MTSDRLCECLAAIRWSQRGLADALDCDERIVRRWASGEASIPSRIAAWLETLTQCHAALPPPAVPRRALRIPAED